MLPREKRSCFPRSQDSLESSVPALKCLKPLRTVGKSGSGFGGTYKTCLLSNAAIGRVPSN